MTNPSGNGKECHKSGSDFGCDEEYHRLKVLALVVCKALTGDEVLNLNPKQ
jgi:hypothetical protein